MFDLIKQLRDETKAPLGEVKKALEAAKGNLEEARKILRKYGRRVLEKRSLRMTGEGVVEAYVHSNGKIGVLVELHSETDFVGRNPEFKKLAHDLAMHVAAMNPLYLSMETVPEEVKSTLYDEFANEVREIDKPDNIKKEMIEGRLSKFLKERTLLEQLYVKDQDKTVGEIMQEAVSKFGENIKVGRFVRFQI